MALLGCHPNAKMDQAVAEVAALDHLAIFVDPVRERALARPEREIDALARAIEPRFDFAEETFKAEA